MATEVERTVFVVDDDLAIRDSLTVLFEIMQVPGEFYATASDFLSAYDPTRGGCLVLDARLPGISGFELLERLAREGFQLPVIMISGHGDSEIKQRAKELGVVEFVEKPYRAERLCEIVKKALKPMVKGR